MYTSYAYTTNLEARVTSAHSMARQLCSYYLE